MAINASADFDAEPNGSFLGMPLGLLGDREFFAMSPDEKRAALIKYREGAKRERAAYKESLSDPAIRAAAAEVATRPMFGPLDGSLVKAFAAFSLDPNDPMDWRHIVSVMARILFPEASNSGRPGKLSNGSYYGVIFAIEDYRRAHPGKPIASAYRSIAKRAEKTEAAIKKQHERALSVRTNKRLARDIEPYSRKIEEQTGNPIDLQLLADHYIRHLVEERHRAATK